MDGSNRLATTVVLAGVAALAILMAYTLGLGSGLGRILPGFSAATAEVAVVFPDRDDWMNFRQGLTACAARKLGSIERDDPDDILMRTEPGRRLVRFRWVRASGSVETRSVLDDLPSRPGGPPVAVVGSSNTALTVELAEALARLPDGPALLVPWATADRTDRHPDGGPDRAPLLELHPGRTFRFAPGNRRQADEVVRVAHQAGDARAPGRVVIVIDRADPYAVDLAAGFEAAIHRLWPELVVTTLEGEGPSPGLSDTPGPAEIDAARRLWDLAREAVSVPTWIILPLQAEPTRRLIRALAAEAPAADAMPAVKVLCGDGIGPESLERLGPALPFGVWCVSTDLAIGSEAELPGDAQVPAEIAAALLRVIDEAPEPVTADAVVAGLTALHIQAGDRSAFGRPLAFDQAGERRAGDLGLILERPAGSREIIPHRPALVAVTRSREIDQPREGFRPPAPRSVR